MELLSLREAILKFIINSQIDFQIGIILYLHCQWMRIVIADRNQAEEEILICRSDKEEFLGKWYNLTGRQGKEAMGLCSWLALYSQ